MSRQEYEETKRLLQIELLKLQAWVSETGQKVCLVFEGRDAAGKGGTIKRFMEHLNPRGATRRRARRSDRGGAGAVVLPAVGASTCRRAGQIVLFDRSWYTRAVVERVMGYCTTEQYVEFLRHVPEFERSLQASDTTVIKLWFSVSRKEQVTRFTIRRIDPVRQWKLSPSDLASLDLWDDFTAAKESMFLHTDTTARAVDSGAQQRQEAWSGRGDQVRVVAVRLRPQEP